MMSGMSVLAAAPFSTHYLMVCDSIRLAADMIVAIDFGFYAMQALTNRRLLWQEKMKCWATCIVLFGIFAGLLGTLGKHMSWRVPVITVGCLMLCVANFAGRREDRWRPVT